MKILFCTNKFNDVSNGPAKFANLILKINEIYPEHQIKILTDDVDFESEYVYKVNIKNSFTFSKLSQFVRIFKYHYAALKIRKEFPFDIIVYNNAFIGLLSAIFFPKAVGMINDDNNIAVNVTNFFKVNNGFKKIIFKQLETLSTRYFSLIIFNSIYLRDFYLNKYGIKKTSILYKGVNISVRRKLNYDIDLFNINILFVKTDFIRGGLIDLITALSLSKYFFSLTVIGCNKEEVQKHLDLSAYKNIKFIFLGNQSQHTVFSELLKTDIFCVPSRSEALGVANLEALAAGVPVVSTNVGGIPEVLDYGSCGLLAEPLNPKDLSNKLEIMASDKLMRDTFVLKGFEHVKNFDFNKVINNFIRILDAN